MNVAVIGTGRVGKVIGGGLAAAGHSVVYASRNPAEQTGLPAPTADVKSAVAGADVVVDAIPGGVVLETLNSIGAEALAGKVLVDVANDLSANFELSYPNASLGQVIQDAFPRTHVVKTLNTVQAPLMNNPSSLPAASTVFLAGNDSDAKSVVGGLLSDLGWPAEWQLDLGDIGQARATEHFIFLSFGIARSLGTIDVNIAVIR
ncbi:NADPH-dependent F420 reductase [Kribbella sp.]|uniref:NADPH-dependent F420 reductase n=1 Tax=Kribbella sp. TaxID=1871183 RepID=UPI002D761F61|nr:NAD(P)-binding domain-containing protein [Kribbella sp.]HZX02133.1 NAD(P)-binding domain-containing protein [Kribbella sp.]